MATVVDPILNFTEDGGAGGLLYTLAPGLSWPAGAKSTYSDKPCANALPNPITINANGQPTTGAGAITPVYGTGQYKLILAANGNTYLTPVWTVDNTDLLGSITSFQSISTYGLNANGLIAANANLANGGYLMIDQPITVGNNVTIGANVVLGMPKANGVNITFANSATLTIYSPFTPVDFQCFTGTGSVVFAANTLQTPPPPIMWGGGAGGAANANAAAVNIIGTLTPGSATPDVSSMLPVYRTSNNGTITSFANATAGQQFTIIANDTNTSLGGGLQGTLPNGPISTGVAIPFLYDGANTHAVGIGSMPTYRNRLINSAMRFDQRGWAQPVGSRALSTGNNIGIMADRWFGSVSGSSSAAYYTLVAGNTSTIPWMSQLLITGANATVANMWVGQRIESNNVFDLANSTVVLSAYIAGVGNGTSVIWSVRYATSKDTWGTSSTAGTLISYGTWAANSTLTRYSNSVNLPANAVNGVSVTFNCSNFANGDTFTITGVQLEVGSAPTSFNYGPDDLELLRCQRYCYSVGYLSNAAGGFQVPGFMRTANNFVATFTPPVPMRVFPPNNWSPLRPSSASTYPDFTIVYANGTTANLGANTTAALGNCSPTIITINYANTAVNNSSAIGQPILFNNSNSAGGTNYVYFDAEL